MDISLDGFASEHTTPQPAHDPALSSGQIHTPESIPLASLSIGGRAVLSRDPAIESFIGLAGTIIIFGGSFDPVHMDHIRCALELRSRIGGDAKVVFLPNKANPEKPQGAVASAFDRFEMLRIALGPYPELMLSGYEAFSDEKTPMTLDTLGRIRSELAPGAQLFFAAGSDILRHHHYYRDISSRQDIFLPLFVERATFDRSQVEGLKSVLSAEDFALIMANFHSLGDHPLASTNIRKELGAGRMPTEGIPPGVGEYIASRFLYGFGPTA